MFRPTDTIPITESYRVALAQQCRIAADGVQSVACPKCKRPYRLLRHLADRRIRCRKCGAMFSGR